MKKINIVTGHYGSGKTNFSANLAVKLAESGEKVTVVDLDIVNPYFRSADFGELFSKKNIELVAPMYANSNLDIPAIQNYRPIYNPLALPYFGLSPRAARRDGFAHNCPG